MKAATTKAIDTASIHFRNDIVYKTNDEFLNLTGYTCADIIGKSIEKLSELLRTNIHTGFKNDKSLYTSYIFTNQDQPKGVEITCGNLSTENKVMYFVEESSNDFLNALLATCINNSESLRISEAIYSYPDLVHLKVNDNYIKEQELFGLEGTGIIGSKYDPLNTSILVNILDNIKEKGSFYREEEELINKEGKTSYWTMKADLIYENDEIRYLKTIFINNTERVVSRKALKKQKAEMELILDNIPDSIVKINNKGEYTYTNKANREKLARYDLDPNDKSLNNEDVIKAFKYNDINGCELSLYDTPDRRLLRGEVIKDYIIIGTRDSSTFYHKCNGTPIYDDKGDIEGAVLIYKDIEDIIKVEEYNALSNNLRNLDINYSVISYIDFRIKYMNNHAFASLRRVHPHVKHLIEVVGDNFFDLYANSIKEKEEIIANIKLCIEDKSYKYVHKHKLIEYGEVKYMKAIFQPVFDENNQIEQISVIGMYITDEELANQAMTKTLKAQAEVFVNTSHELKTQINLIFSASQLLSMHLKSEYNDYKKGKIEHNNKIITQNCYRTIKLINNILDVSKIEQGFYDLRFRNKNIVDVMDSMVMSISDYIKDKELSIIFDPKVEEKIMGLDIYKFERIMLNLISNAIKFSHENGVIFIDLIDKGTSVEVSVKDQGIGIDRENLDSIFNKFKQEDKSLNRNAEGTGIGLSLVKSIVELHEGTIDVESTLNVGTKFTVNLPAKVIEETVIIDDDYNHEDRVEMIKFELSDIYD